MPDRWQPCCPTTGTALPLTSPGPSSTRSLSCFKTSTTTSLQSRLSLSPPSREPRSLDQHPSYGRKLMLPMRVARPEEWRMELDEMSGKEPMTWRANGRRRVSSRTDSTPTTAFVEPRNFFSVPSASCADDAHHLGASDPTPDVVDRHDKPLIEPFPPRQLAHRRYCSDHGPRRNLRRTVLKRHLTTPSSLSAPRRKEEHLSGLSPPRAPSAERLTRLPPPPPLPVDSGRPALELTEHAPSTSVAVEFVQPEEPRCSIPSSPSRTVNTNVPATMMSARPGPDAAPPSERKYPPPESPRRLLSSREEDLQSERRGCVDMG
ncbi:hypothetical protein JCM1841_000482 [Sporobolomyces salmonicolor]